MKKASILIIVIFTLTLLSLVGVAAAQELLIQPKPTETPETSEIPDFCKDLQLPLTLTADKLDTFGFPYPEKWDPDSRICLYSLRDTSSFLLVESFGTFSFGFTETGNPWIIMVAIDYKDSEQTRESFKDWSTTAIANLTGVDIISAQELYASTIEIGMGAYDHYLFMAELNREYLQYRFTVMDMNFVDVNE